MENAKTSPRLLLIDDEPNLLIGLRAVMQKAGYQVLSASNGADGLRAAREQHPDLIICDVMMPAPDGFQLKEILAEDPATSAIPFIFLTARSGNTDRLNGFRGGADDYITKPFNVDELLARVEAVLRRTRIARQRAEQEAEEKLEALRRSLSTHLSHEMRTPLSMVISTLELALKDKFSQHPGDQSWYLSTALSSAQRLQNLTEDMLYLNSMDQGTLSTFREQIDLNYHFKEVVRRTAERYAASGVQLQMQIAPDVVIHAPRAGFILTIRHLVENAFKFSPANGAVEINLQANGEGGCRLTLQDQGPGIPPDLREKVFERYFQIEQGDTRSHDGLGLGLTLARAFARSLGGDVEIADSSEGCRVQLILPPAPLDWKPAA